MPWKSGPATGFWPGEVRSGHVSCPRRSSSGRVGPDRRGLGIRVPVLHRAHPHPCLSRDTIIRRTARPRQGGGPAPPLQHALRRPILGRPARAVRGAGRPPHPAVDQPGARRRGPRPAAARRREMLSGIPGLSCHGAVNPPRERVIGNYDPCTLVQFLDGVRGGKLARFALAGIPYFPLLHGQKQGVFVPWQARRRRHSSFLVKVHSMELRSRRQTPSTDRSSRSSN